MSDSPQHHPSHTRRATFALAALLLAAASPASPAAKVSECTRIGMCYCISSDAKPAVEAKVANLRQLIAEQRKSGKTIGYLSVPLSPAGGGYMKLNAEVAAGAKTAVEKRFGSDFAFVLNPAMPETDLPKDAGGPDYMLMWSAVLEGANGMGEDIDFVYFVR